MTCALQDPKMAEDQRVGFIALATYNSRQALDSIGNAWYLGAEGSQYMDNQSDKHRNDV